MENDQKKLSRRGFLGRMAQSAGNVLKAGTAGAVVFGALGGGYEAYRQLHPDEEPSKSRRKKPKKRDPQPPEEGGLQVEKIVDATVQGGMGGGAGCGSLTLIAEVASKIRAPSTGGKLTWGQRRQMEQQQWDDQQRDGGAPPQRD